MYESVNGTTDTNPNRAKKRLGYRQLGKVTARSERKRKALASGKPMAGRVTVYKPDANGKLLNHGLLDETKDERKRRLDALYSKRRRMDQRAGFDNSNATRI